MIPVLLRLGLGGLFLWSAYDKILHPHDFATMVAAYQLVPDRLVTLVATLLPFVEAVCGLTLLVGFLTESSALVLGLLSGGFALAVASAAARGLDIECGCFSTSQGGARADWWHVALNLAMLAAAVYLVKNGSGTLAVDNRLLRPAEAEE